MTISAVLICGWCNAQDDHQRGHQDHQQPDWSDPMVIASQMLDRFLRSATESLPRAAKREVFQDWEQRLRSARDSVALWLSQAIAIHVQVMREESPESDVDVMRDRGRAVAEDAG